MMNILGHHCRWKGGLNKTYKALSFPFFFAFLIASILLQFFLLLQYLCSLESNISDKILLAQTDYRSIYNCSPRISKGAIFNTPGPADSHAFLIGHDLHILEFDL